MSTNTRPHKIHLTCGEMAKNDEGPADVLVTPGMLLQQGTTAKHVKPHASAGSYAQTMFATEAILLGKGIDDNYAIGDVVFYCIAEKGDHVLALLADGENVIPTDFLTSNGDGSLKKASSTNERIAQPLEALDNSETNSAIAKRIRVRIL